MGRILSVPRPNPLTCKTYSLAKKIKLAKNDKDALAYGNNRKINLSYLKKCLCKNIDYKLTWKSSLIRIEHFL